MGSDPSVSDAQIQATVVERVKELLGDARDRIRLDEYVTGLLRKSVQALAQEPSPSHHTAVTPETLKQRLEFYEEAVRDLTDATILLARWGRIDQTLLLERIVAHLAENARISSGRAGLPSWQLLSWHPISVMTTAAGSAALLSQNHWVLRSLLLTPVRVNTHSSERRPAMVQVWKVLGEVQDIYKLVSGNPGHRVPRSEYLFARMRKPLDDLLFVGEGYELLFDDFEILSALVYADLTARDDGTVWAMPGRFGYKFKHAGQPYDQFVESAISMGCEWPFLKLGFFQSSADRFKIVADAYRKFLVALPWY